MRGSVALKLSPLWLPIPADSPNTTCLSPLQNVFTASVLMMTERNSDILQNILGCRLAYSDPMELSCKQTVLFAFSFSLQMHYMYP